MGICPSPYSGQLVDFFHPPPPPLGQLAEFSSRRPEVSWSTFPKSQVRARVNWPTFPSASRHCPRSPLVGPRPRGQLVDSFHIPQIPTGRANWSTVKFPSPLSRSTGRQFPRGRLSTVDPSTLGQFLSRLKNHRCPRPNGSTPLTKSTPGSTGRLLPRSTFPKFPPRVNWSTRVTIHPHFGPYRPPLVPRVLPSPRPP